MAVLVVRHGADRGDAGGGGFSAAQAARRAAVGRARGQRCRGGREAVDGTGTVGRDARPGLGVRGGGREGVHVYAGPIRGAETSEIRTLASIAATARRYFGREPAASLRVRTPRSFTFFFDPIPERDKMANKGLFAAAVLGHKPVRGKQV